MTRLRLQNICKRFGKIIALADVSLDIAAGELFFLLGPSGCGKSTLLRIIAGLLDPDGGSVLFNDEDVTKLPTQQRRAVMCFQSYALWPHMTVRENVSFGLSMQRVSPAARQSRVDQVLALVQMQELADRRPNELSGGQQQRVALARALAVNPRCLLLDEPLSNLDAKLRQEMRGEIRRICKQGDFTTVYVTHDQKEALSIADRIALLKDGRLVQVGTPGQLYYRPATSFVADFIGHTNLLPGRLIGSQGRTLSIDTPVGRLLACCDQPKATQVLVSIRPEQMRLVLGGPGSPQANRLSGMTVSSTFLGEASEHTLRINDQELRVVRTPPLFEVPPTLTVEFDPADVVLLTE